MLGTILTVILVLVLLGALPCSPHSRNWVTTQPAGWDLFVVIVVVRVLLGRT
jgi:hypothetical protein